jgi:hypothetical protein
MPPPTPQQQLRRARLEGLIGAAAPFLDLVLAAGDRISRIVGPSDDYIPIRAPAEAFELGPTRPSRAERPSRGEVAD